MTSQSDSKAHLEFVRRHSTFEAFGRCVLDKRDLAEALEVSRPTAHRIISSFEGAELITQTDGGYELTRYGEIVGDTVETYIQDISTATSLKPLINGLPDELGFDHRLFATAVVTDATYDDPFRPMNRFINLFRGATRIKGFNKSFLEPMYIELAHEQIEDGMQSDIVYEPKVIELILAEYPNIAAKAFENKHMVASIHDDLPLALAIFEDRIGIGVHAESMGTPISWIDTDNPEAIAWGEAIFEKYKSEAQPLGAGASIHHYRMALTAESHMI